MRDSVSLYLLFLASTCLKPTDLGLRRCHLPLLLPEIQSAQASWDHWLSESGISGQMKVRQRFRKIEIKGLDSPESTRLRRGLTFISSPVFRRYQGQNPYVRDWKDTWIKSQSIQNLPTFSCGSDSARWLPALKRRDNSRIFV